MLFGLDQSVRTEQRTLVLPVPHISCWTCHDGEVIRIRHAVRRRRSWLRAGYSRATGAVREGWVACTSEPPAEACEQLDEQVAEVGLAVHGAHHAGLGQALRRLGAVAQPLNSAKRLLLLARLGALDLGPCVQTDLQQRGGGSGAWPRLGRAAFAGSAWTMTERGRRRAFASERLSASVAPRWISGSTTIHVVLDPIEFMRYIRVPHPFGAASGCANRQSCRCTPRRLKKGCDRNGVLRRRHRYQCDHLRSTTRSSRRAELRTAAVGGEHRRVSVQRPGPEKAPANGILTARCPRAG